MQQGMQQGVVKTLTNLIQLKFGNVPEWARQRVEQASQEQLERWTAAILTADSLESMLGQH